MYAGGVNSPLDTSRHDLPRRIGFWGAAAVMIGVIVGSGIFKSPVAVADNIGSPAVILGLWALGGMLALVGGLTYAELTTRYPRSGGLYVFLREGYGRAGPPLAFTFGWTYMLITKPFAAAGIMVPGAEHILKLAGFAAADGAVPELPKLVLTTGLLVLFTWVNVPGVRLGTGLAMLLTTVKFGALALIVLVALALMKGDAANFRPTAAPSQVGAIAAFTMAMSTILWSYDGWADVGSIAGEVKNPRRTLPRVFLVGVLGCTGLYLAVNAVFIWMVPLAEMAKADTIAPMVAGRLIGGEAGAAAMVVTALIVVSTLGSSHASIITGARVTFAQARDGLLFRSLGRIHPEHRTPAVALWVQCGLSIAAVWMLGGSFQRLADGFVFTMWIFYGLAGVALLLIRGREAGGARGAGPGASGEAFRCPMYPLVPLLFIASAFGMSALQIAGDWRGTLPWAAVLLAGAPMYYLWRRITRPDRSAAGQEG